MEKTKKIINVLIIFLLCICIFSITSNATEDNIDNVEIEEELPEIYTATVEDYYEYNEKLHNQTTFKAKTYNSSTTGLSLEEYILQESLTCPEYIDVSSYEISLDDAKAAFAPVFYYDEAFYFGSTYSWGWDVIYTSEDHTEYTLIASKLYCKYTLTADEIQEAWKTINKEVKIYKAGIKKEWNDLEKIIYTNNFLCKLCQYGYGDEEINDRLAYTIYGALVSNYSVCDGYSHAVRYLLKQIGMDSEIISSSTMNHAWNLVKIDGEYYHLDVTWDDSYYNSVGGVGITTYEFFLASDTEFESGREELHYDWTSDIECTSTKYDSGMPWEDYNNYLIYKDDYWYMMGNDGNTWDASLYKLDLRDSGSAIEKILIKTNNTSDYIFWQPGFTTDGTNLYYSTEFKIFQMDFNGENLVEYYEIEDTTNYCIYSLEIIGDVFYYDTTELDRSGSYITTDAQTRKTNICDIYEAPEKDLVYTTYETQEIDDVVVIVLSAGQKISDILVSDNFPVMDESYIVEVYNSSDEVKTDTEKVGSKNIIKITDPTGTNVVKEYTIVVKGDVNGDGKVKIYDAFQILKQVLFKGSSSFSNIEILMCDYNGDSKVKMYDAFAYLKQSLFGK